MISSFKAEYSFLSNFWDCAVEYEDIVYPSAEHAYVAAKTMDIGIRHELVEVKTPGLVKRMGRKIVLRPDWESIKLDVMIDIVWDKFERHPALMQKLQATKPHDLIEGNTWGDTTWGQCPVGNGTNWLGRILMSIRDKGDSNGKMEQ